MIVRIIKSLTSTSTFIALNGMMVILFCFILYEVEINTLIFIISFLVTFSAYNLNKATDKVEDSFNRPESVERSGRLYIYSSIITMALGIAIAALISFFTLIIIIVSITASLAYSVKLGNSKIRLKSIVCVKSLVVAFSWAFTGALLPIKSIDFVGLEKIVLVFFYIFNIIFVNTILCDIIDMFGDIKSGLKTIPIAIGLKKTKILLIIINSLLVIWLLYCIIKGVFAKHMLALVFGVLYGFGNIWLFTVKINSNFLIDLLVDGEWIPLTFLSIIL
jgi:4-hydroxybenzoate polyprenyltransferase